MNIWYISKYATPIKYYFGTRHFYLAEEWINQGHEVSIITSNSSHLTNNLPQFKGTTFIENINGIKTIWLNIFKSKNSSGISRILSWFHFDLLLLLLSKKQWNKPNVIIISSLSLTTVMPAWILSKIYKAKLVFEVRDIWPLSIIMLGNYSKNNLFIKYLSFVEKFGYEKSNLIVGTMPNLKGHINNLNVQWASKCICIPQGISLNFYENQQQQLANEYISKWIPENKFIVCYAGTINKNNPLNTLIESANILKSNSKIHFVVLGSGDKKEEIMDMVNTHQLNNVSFPTPIKKNEMLSFLKHVHITFDSFKSELASYGLSRNKWIDYMYAEKPIICSFDGYQSMINEANCGSFVKFEDATALANCINLYANMSIDEIKKIGSNGKKFLLAKRKFKTLSQEYINQIMKS